MQTVTYPNGQVLTTTELTIQQINLVFRTLTLQALGINPGAVTTLTTVTGSTTATVLSGSGIIQGQTIVSAGVPPGSVVDGISGASVTLSAAATATGLATASFGADSGAFDAVRLDWAAEGQPGFTIGNDYCFLRCVERDDPYNRIRENGPLTLINENTFSQITTWTRCWDVTWELWGPNSTTRGNWIRDGIQLDWASDILAGSNLFSVPDIARIERVPQNFQDQWWETAYLTCEFNEFVTQTLTTQAGASVELIVSDPSGVLADKTFNLGES
jgi:hypothetical protein